MTGTTSPFLNRPVTNPDIFQASITPKIRKVQGKDGKTNEIIKASLPDMCSVLNKLVNIILSTGLNPDSWKTGVNVHFCKSGDPIHPSNYHGIIPNSSLRKLLCEILNSRIVDYLENNNVSSKEKAGFRKGFRTTDHVIICPPKYH